MSVQFLAQWNGFERYQVVSTLSAAEETRLIGLGICQAYYAPSPVSGAGVALQATGNDDAALVSEYVQDMASSKLPATLGAGDFMIGSPMTWRSGQLISKWGGTGIGLKLLGQGSGNTRLLYAAALGNTAPAISINAPVDANIGRRNYLTHISGLSMLRAPGGVQIAAGSTDGSAIACVPLAASGDVLHTPKFSDLFIDGFSYPITLSDCTLADIDTLWCVEFLAAIRLGYNCDIIKIRHSMFGSEQFGATYRNNAIAIQTGYADGFNAAGNGNNIEVEHTWMMKIGCGIELGAQDIFSMTNVYLEDCRQYVRNPSNTKFSGVLDRCTFSKPNSNDDVTLAKIVMGSGALSRLAVSNCDGGSTAPLGAWVENTGFNPTIEWRENNMQPGGLGHYRWAASGNERSISFSSGSGGGRVNTTLSRTYGLTKVAGEDRVATLGTTGAVTADYWAADIFEIPAMTGNVTVNISGGSVPAVRGTRLKFRIQASASAPSTTTVTFPGVVFGTAFSQAGASDASKWTVIEVERTASNWMCVSPPNQWVV